MKFEARAKINLSLDVLFKRADGYHELRTVMAETSLCDDVFAEAAEELCVESSVPLPPDNTAMRAASLYMARYGCGGAHIYIEKRIPSEAGLGGASADAAAVLRAMQSLYGAPAAEAELYSLARQVGADVPFCLHGGTALCEGIGERITSLAPVHAHVLLVKGERGVSTGELFRSLSLPLAHPDTSGILNAIAQSELPKLGSRLFNALEAPAAALVPEIARYKSRLLAAGALGACMSGSGSCVFGLFESEESAQRALADLSDAPFAHLCSI